MEEKKAAIRFIEVRKIGDPGVWMVYEHREGCVFDSTKDFRKSKEQEKTAEEFKAMLLEAGWKEVRIYSDGFLRAWCTEVVPVRDGAEILKLRSRISKAAQTGKRPAGMEGVYGDLGQYDLAYDL